MCSLSLSPPPPYLTLICFAFDMRLSQEEAQDGALDWLQNIFAFFFPCSLSRLLIVSISTHAHRCWQYQPERRPSMQQVHDELCEMLRALFTDGIEPPPSPYAAVPHLSLNCGEVYTVVPPMADRLKRTMLTNVEAPPPILPSSRRTRSRSRSRKNANENTPSTAAASSAAASTSSVSVSADGGSGVTAEALEYRGEPDEEMKRTRPHFVSVDGFV